MITQDLENKTEEISEQSNKSIDKPELFRKRPRVALYIHSDASKSDSKSSIKNQINACIRFAEDKGWDIADLYIERKETCNGANQSMHKLMFARAISRRFDYVVASTACRTSKELIDVVAVFDNKLIARLKSLTKKTPNMQVQYKARRVQQ